MAAKKCTKKRDARAKLLFRKSEPTYVLLFCRSRCRHRRRCLSSLVWTCHKPEAIGLDCCTLLTKIPEKFPVLACVVVLSKLRVSNPIQSTLSFDCCPPIHSVVQVAYRTLDWSSENHEKDLSYTALLKIRSLPKVPI